MALSHSRLSGAEIVLSRDVVAVADPKGRRIWPSTGRVPAEITPTLVWQAALMAQAFLDGHWPAVHRLVRVLFACRLPVTLTGPVVTRLIESTS